MLNFVWIAILTFSLGTTYAQDTEKAKIVLTHQENIRKLVNEVLDIAATLPVGSVVELPGNVSIVHYDFRNSQGSVQRSSNGFFSQVKVLSIPNQTPDEIARLNEIAGGLFLTATIQPNVTVEGEFTPINNRSVGSDYSKNYIDSGKPVYKFTKYLVERFGTQLNRSIASEDISVQDQEKWKAIMEELQKALDRTQGAQKKYLYMTQNDADYYSRAYENQGLVSEFGAWSVAVKSTAPRHGFANVPCAEFVSEIIRQAYQRAGFDIFSDFNDAKKNKLIWSSTAAVVNLSQALYIAGWIPWDMSVYRPLTGAPTMHERATSPGHAYISAGFDGRLIVDNGSPSGRDLGQTSDKIIKLMYLGGVFFLPPGFIPTRWDEVLEN